MATQQGQFKFTGKLGGLIGYRYHDGRFLVKTASGVDKETFDNDPNYEVPRKLTKEFTTAAEWGTSFRRAANRVLMNCCQQVKLRSLTLTMLKNIRSNQVGLLGSRTIDIETIGSYLEDFDFSDWGLFDTAFMRKVEIDISASSAVIEFRTHDSDEDINQPTNATHYSLAAACVMLSENPMDWEAKQVLEPIALHAIGSGQIPKIELTVPNPTEGVGNLRIYVVGIHFWHLVNGRWLPVREGRNNAAKVLAIDYGQI